MPTGPPKSARTFHAIAATNAIDHLSMNQDHDHATIGDSCGYEANIGGS